MSQVLQSALLGLSLGPQLTFPNTEESQLTLNRIIGALQSLSAVRTWGYLKTRIHMIAHVQVQKWVQRGYFLLKPQRSLHLKPFVFRQNTGPHPLNCVTLLVLTIG